MIRILSDEAKDKIIALAMQDVGVGDLVCWVALRLQDGDEFTSRQRLLLEHKRPGAYGATNSWRVTTAMAYRIARHHKPNIEVVAFATLRASVPISIGLIPSYRIMPYDTIDGDILFEVGVG